MALLDDLYSAPSMGERRERVNKIIELQKQAQQIEDPALKRKEDGNYRRMLDNLYWEIFEELGHLRLSDSGSLFNLSEKILVNYGLLSYAQLEESETLQPSQIDSLLVKLQGRSPYDDAPIYRLDEWASIWHMNAQLFDAEEKKTPEPEDWLDDEKAKRFLNTRLNIYKKILPTLKALPGANLPFLRSLLTGEFDKKVELSMALEIKDREKIDIGHRRIISLYKTLLDQLRAALQDPEQKKLIILLDKINQSFVQRRIRQEIAQGDFTHNEEDKKSLLKKEMINNEIKLIKSLLPIGGMEGKEFFTSPILRQTQALISKTFVGDTLKLIHLCDPHVPHSLPVIIVPFRGSGFFEFDKNTLIIPLFPSIAPQEVIIRAVGNYRLLTDQLEHKGEMKRVYEKTFEKGRFKEKFLQDYVQWITHISRGHRSIMPRKKFDFFMNYVGPNPKNLLCEPLLQDLPNVQLKRKINDLLSIPQMNQEQYLTVATCHWLLQDTTKAVQYCEAALTAGMPNPKVFLANGYALRETKDKAKSLQMFKNCYRYYKNTIWGAYAAHEMGQK
jgi:hypothetical protein